MENKKITDMTINEIFTNISKSCVDFTFDVFNKPKNIGTMTHIQYSLVKDDRYAFIGLFLMGISAYGFISKNNS